MQWQPLGSGRGPETPWDPEGPLPQLGVDGLTPDPAWGGREAFPTGPWYPTWLRACSLTLRAPPLHWPVCHLDWLPRATHLAPRPLALLAPHLTAKPASWRKPLPGEFLVKSFLGRSMFFTFSYFCYGSWEW